MKKQLLVLLFLFSAVVTYSQHTITGVVTSSEDADACAAFGQAPSHYGGNCCRTGCFRRRRTGPLHGFAERGGSSF